MRTFEEKWTAWLDGQLSAKEAAEFEASLPDRAAAEEEKQATQKLGRLLQAHLVAKPMGNEEFFNHQLRTRLEAEDSKDSTRQSSSPVWSIGRLLWVGATSLAIFAVCAVFVMREKKPTDQSQYLSQILNARVDPNVSPYATVSIFQTKQDKVTVLWVDGLKSLPAEYAAK
jgi:anti-sigma factor RsiW